MSKISATAPVDLCSVRTCDQDARRADSREGAGRGAGVVLDAYSEADEPWAAGDRRRERSGSGVGGGREGQGVSMDVALHIPLDVGCSGDGEDCEGEGEEGGRKHCRKRWADYVEGKLRGACEV